MQQGDALTGYSMLALILLALLASLGLEQLSWAAGFFAWLAALRLFSRLTSLQKGQVLVMFLLGFSGLFWGLWREVDLHWWRRAWEANQALLTMLLSVSFLRLVAITDLAAKEALPRGKKALWKTLLGVHAFGAVINFSAMIIMADRLNNQRPLTPLQALVITRGFTMAANWSPFFAAMGVVLISAPGADLLTLMLVGSLVAAIGLFLAGYWLLAGTEAAETQGYPMHLQALVLPFALAVSVLVSQSIWEDLAILTLVSLLSLIFTLVLLVWRYRLQLVTKRLRQHIEHTLPSMSGELLLFMGAGVLAAGLGAALQAAEFTLQLDYFGPWQAWWLLVVLVLVSAVGVHPVISIATAGGIFAPWVDDPNLLALVFLMTWSLGVAISPLSGTHLAMQGRYGLPAHSFTRLNFKFVLLMLLVNWVALQAYSYLISDSFW
ncbi:hypothetical protein SAMN05660443_0008 [Marinospirillum celere]|uniref:Uncharacterized protein n=1 Tax=Marinospirillum celere TaxID=1122252 RepID=A0A1I1JV31_9GAMM|nr:hypothetical protein [Marinospirillum celere]SFC52091.1 hypothetical protein SAMN05660443_0008 [Marinospirillum celere]